MQEAHKKDPKAERRLDGASLRWPNGSSSGRSGRIFGGIAEALGDGPEPRLAQAEYLLRRDGKEGSDRAEKLSEGTEKFSGPQLLQLWKGLLSEAVQMDDAPYLAKLCRQIAEKEPSNVTVRNLLFDQALQARDDAAMTRASAEIEQAGGKNAYWYYGQAARLTLQSKGRADADQLLNQASAYLAKARGLRQSWSRIPLLAADIYSKQGRVNDALKKPSGSHRTGRTQPRRDPADRADPLPPAALRGSRGTVSPHGERASVVLAGVEPVGGDHGAVSGRFWPCLGVGAESGRGGFHELPTTSVAGPKCWAFSAAAPRPAGKPARPSRCWPTPKRPFAAPSNCGSRPRRRGWSWCSSSASAAKPIKPRK